MQGDFRHEGSRLLRVRHHIASQPPARRRSCPWLRVPVVVAVLGACTQTDAGVVHDPQAHGTDSGSEAQTDSGDYVELDLFSFFVTSQVAMQDLSGSEYGFGGDLRYGETGPGAGLKGADRICADIAERSMPGASVKQWRAFLSAHEGEDGAQVDAIDRIGEGPWYDRVGRLVAPSRDDLLHTRPANGDSEIADDLPNENGVPNSEVDPGADTANERNHHMLTGSTVAGTLYPPRCYEESHDQGLVEACQLACLESGGLSIEHYTCDNCELPIEDFDVLDEFCRSACEGPDGYTSDCDTPVNATCNDWTSAEPDQAESMPRIGLSWPRDDRTVDQEWISWWHVSGCAPVGSVGGDGSSGEAGQPGSYGGFYCFALEP